MNSVPLSFPRPSAIIVALTAVLLGCSGGEPPPSRAGERAQGRKGDPELSHHWEMPAEASVLQSADLGSTPPQLADALMAGSAAPGISHRMTTACAGEGALEGTATVALRFNVTEEGAIEKLEGDPAGKTADCFTKLLPEELLKLEQLPAGAALLVLRFHGRAAK